MGGARADVLAEIARLARLYAGAASVQENVDEVARGTVAALLVLASPSRARVELLLMLSAMVRQISPANDVAGPNVPRAPGR